VGVPVDLSSSGQTIVQSSLSDAGPGLFFDDDTVSARDPHGEDSLARLLATAALAVDIDRPLTRMCIQRAATLLGLELSVGGSLTAQRFRPQSGLLFWQVKRVKLYIEDNLASTIRAPDLAEFLHLSTSHFHRGFRKAFGVSPIAYVIRRRIRRAQELILNSQASLSQVALECGMCDQAHLSRAFRRIVGSSPSAWRRQLACLAPDADVIERRYQDWGIRI
jgi:AraC family transcriptional regulator